jgi:hypothetical protein
MFPSVDYISTIKNYACTSTTFIYLYKLYKNTWYIMNKTEKFINFLENAKTADNKAFLGLVTDGFKLCFEAHSGFDRTIDRIAESAGLEYSNWDSYLKREMGNGIKNIIYPREVLGFMKDNDSQRAMTSAKAWVELLQSINYKFESPKVIDFRPSDFNKEIGGATNVIGGQRVDHSTYSGFKQRLYNEISIDENKHDDSIGDEVSRHSKQKHVIGKSGVNQEPVMLTKKGNKFDLHEGWHRVLRLFKNKLNELLPSYIEKFYSVDDYEALDETGKASVRSSLFTKMIEFDDVPIRLNAYIGELVPVQKEQKSKLQKIISSFAKSMGVGKEVRAEKQKPKPSTFNDTFKDS